MIVLTSPNGTKHYLHPNAIARVSHAGPNSSRIGAHVKTFDGGSIEAQESADSIAQDIERAEKGQSCE